MSETEVFIIVDDRLFKSVARDAVSFGSLIAAIGIGWVIESNALQWIGGLMWIFFIFSRALAVEKKSKRHTIASARERLDELERET